MEKKILLKRVKSTDQCTLGEIYVDGQLICRCLELPWRNNEPRSSCIPPGRYPVVFRLTTSSKYKYRHLHVQDVPGRQWILFHKGNFPKDTLGCILPGMSHAGNSVKDSGIAFDKLMATLSGATRMTLTIVPV